MRVLMALLLGLLGSSAAVAGDQCAPFPVCIPVPSGDVTVQKSSDPPKDGQEEWLITGKGRNGATYETKIYVMTGTHVNAAGLDGMLQLVQAQKSDALRFQVWGDEMTEGLWVETRLWWSMLDQGKRNLPGPMRCDAQTNAMLIDQRAIAGTDLAEKIGMLIRENHDKIRQDFVALAKRLYESRFPCTDGRRLVLVPYRF